MFPQRPDDLAPDDSKTATGTSCLESKLIANMKMVQLSFLAVKQAGRIDLPEGDFTVVEIKNYGTHGTADVCIINNQWKINGGDTETPSLFYLEGERDKTDWQIEWAASAIDKNVLIIFKLYKDN